MRPPAPRHPTSILAAALLLGALGAGCGKEIGDGCANSAECSPNGDRLCDRSQPGGYCTVEGCNETSCPDEATCVRFFPTLALTKPCDPEHEDEPSGPDDCTPDELCLPEAVCAPRASERRYCMRRCGNDGDCRGDYECRLAGTRGTVPLTRATTPRKFCAPK